MTPRIWCCTFKPKKMLNMDDQSENYEKIITDVCEAYRLWSDDIDLICTIYEGDKITLKTNGNTAEDFYVDLKSKTLVVSYDVNESLWTYVYRAAALAKTDESSGILSFNLRQPLHLSGQKISVVRALAEGVCEGCFEEVIDNKKTLTGEKVILLPSNKIRIIYKVNTWV